MRRAMIFIGAVTCALVAGCAGQVDPQQEALKQEATASSQAADTVCTNGVCTTTITGHVKFVDIWTASITIEANGGSELTLTHTNQTVHISVVPGPMRGVVPGPMHWLWRLWNQAIQNNEQALAFLILLDDLAFHHGKVTVTTTNGSTLDSVQPVP